MWIKKEKLEGNFVVLEQLKEVHIEPLKKAVLDGEPWKLWFANIPNPENMSDYVKQAIHDAKNGNIAFAVRAKSSGNIVGSTRYYNVDEANRRVMIGYTWLCCVIDFRSRSDLFRLIVSQHGKFYAYQAL